MLLGIILKNENVFGDMIDILLYLNEYVLWQSQNAVDNLTQKEVSHDAIYEILLSGDQLTRRVRKGGKMSSLATQLKDLFLSIKIGTKRFFEVSHNHILLKLCTSCAFLQMIWKWLYNTKSFRTLCHLRNIIDHRNTSATSTDDFNTCDDFYCYSVMFLLLQCTIIK